MTTSSITPRAPVLLAAILAILALLASASAPAWAQDGPERFESVETEFAIRPDGTLEARHVIEIVARGEEIKRGIYLEFPDEIGRVRNVRATRNGAPEKWEWDDGDLIIADLDVRIPAGPHTYVLTYEAERPLVRDLTGEEPVLRFTWRPFMHDSDLPWARSTLTVSWPERARPASVRAGGGEAARPRFGETSRSWRFAGPLGDAADGEPMASPVRLTWADGAFPASTAREKSVSEALRWYAPLGFLGVWLVYHLAWRSIGRDGDPGPAFERRDPPSGVSPAAVRHIVRMGFDGLALVAAMVNLAVRGAVRLRFDGKTVELEQAAPGAATSEEERAFMETAFEKSPVLDLKKNAGRAAKAAGALSKSLSAMHGGRMFHLNLRAWGWCFAIASVYTAYVIWGMVEHSRGPVVSDDIGIVIALLSMTGALIVGLVYVGFFKAPTREGRRVMDEAAGLKRYLEAETPLTDEDADPARFLELLPYAVALDAQKNWEARFGDRLDEAEDPRARELLSWYRTIMAEAKRADDATFAAVILPVIASSSGGSAGGGGGGAGGGSAGGV